MSDERAYRAIGDRVRAYVSARISELERQPGLLDLVRARREGALAELRLLDARLEPAVRSVGGWAPTPDEIDTLERWIDGTIARVERSRVEPLLRRLVAAYRRSS